MVSLLARLFIKDWDNYKNPRVRNAYVVLCGVVGVVLNLLLFAAKFITGSIAKSVAITADAFNNLFDTGSSLINLLGIKMASKAPDEEHPFGHGRIEYLSGAAVAVIIVAVGFELGKESVLRIINHTEIEVSLLSILILVGSICVKAYIYAYNTSIGKKTDSPGMRAVAIDSISDCVSTTVVLLSMLISKFFNINLDGWSGVLVSIFIVYSGIKVAMETLSPLLGKTPEPELIKQIADIVRSHPYVVNVHDIIVHNYGPGKLFVSLHAEVPGDGDIFAMHDSIDNAEYELKKQLGCEAVIHMDPISVDDDKVSSMKKELISRVDALEMGITIHDFRIVDGPTHTNVVFDAVLNSELQPRKTEIKKQLEDIVRSLWSNTHPKIKIDRTYY